MYLLTFDNGVNLSMLWVNKDLKTEWICISPGFDLVDTKNDDQLLVWSKEIQKLSNPDYAKTKYCPLSPELVLTYLKSQAFQVLKAS